MNDVTMADDNSWPLKYSRRLHVKYRGNGSTKNVILKD